MRLRLRYNEKDLSLISTTGLSEQTAVALHSTDRNCHDNVNHPQTSAEKWTQMACTYLANLLSSIALISFILDTN
jgi:hypothetical protein